jgi:hypothetical protein
MSEPLQTIVTFDEAKACPTCKHPGKIVQSNAITGGTLHKLMCVNELCPWYQTFWFVETDSSGQVQVNEKAYAIANATRLQPRLDPKFDEKHEAVLRALDRQAAEETRNSE